MRLFLQLTESVTADVRVDRVYSRTTRRAVCTSQLYTAALHASASDAQHTKNVSTRLDTLPRATTADGVG